MTAPAWLCLVPAVVTILVALLSRRTVESLLVGVLTGLLLLDPGALVPNFSALILEVMMDETVAWVIIVCGLMGSLITLLMRAGAATAFSSLLAKRARSGPTALIYTWLLGLLIFIDDYLNALAVGTAMRKATDQHRVSRPMLAYVVDSTAAPVCMLVPISTWAVFFAGVLEASNQAAKGEGMQLFIESIPYMLYPWIAVLMVPLVALGVIPLMGSMVRVERQAREGALPRAMDVTDFVSQSDDTVPHPRVKIYHFLIPIISLLVFSGYHDLDIQIGVIMSLVVTISLFGVQRLMPWGELFDSLLDGIKIMVPALSIVVVAFMFKDVNDQLGLAPFVIENVTPYMTATLLPLVVFLTLALISFATGSSWGIFAIAIPIVMPLAAHVGVSPPLAIGALMSASAFGSHACFYSDSTVLASQGAGCNVMEHALTQFPYAMIAATLAAVGLTLLAWVL